MNSRAHAAFWAAFDALPADIQELAKAKYRPWEQDPFHPSLYFKHVGSNV